MNTLPLFERYPLLGEKLSHVSLAELPTPVQKLDGLGRVLGVERLYIKRDDLSGTVYGGNKPRKLEFILGEVLRSGVSEVITFGCAGSNHALATTIYGSQVGVHCVAMLMHQPNAYYVRRNLLLAHHFGAEMHLCGAELESRWNRPLVFFATLREMVRSRLLSGTRPVLVSPGGSSVIGVTGYVNAALELVQQVQEGKMPVPDLIYVACGTLGTAAGLILGLEVAGLAARVVPVLVTGGDYVNAERMASLVNRTSVHLHALDTAFPPIAVPPTHIAIQPGFLGERYAQFTREGMEAVSLMSEYEGIPLEGTYTGKALAALIADVRDGWTRDKTILFWNTVNSRDLSELAASVDYHELPRAFHRYFEEEVQPLDR
jgi:1-aminocyclopropane-1-carboxylate deaminase/D-cysteine desulfhydrase-like pyridoxal-dependent ACC family enzyme